MVNFSTEKHNLRCYKTPSHPCSYIDQLEAINIFVDPSFPVNSTTFSLLSGHGFRRSGVHFYRPSCKSCTACLPIRIPVEKFKLSRSQYRNQIKNRDITVTPSPALFKNEHYELFCQYVNSRHKDGGMDDPTPESYNSFLSCPGIKSVAYEFRLENKLIAVSVTDLLPDSLSAVYTFFNPEFSSRGLGVFSILWQIKKTHELGLKWLYLGYLIKECEKMSYKDQYRPHELLINNHWQTFHAS